MMTAAYVGVYVSTEGLFDPECDFCAIARGLQGAHKVIRAWSDVVLFSPLEPATAGHVLVIPRSHVNDIFELDCELSHSLCDRTLEVCRVIREALLPDGLNVITSAGAVATQTVFHLHIHIVPRYVSDNMGEIWPAQGVGSAVEKKSVGVLRRAFANIH